MFITIGDKSTLLDYLGKGILLANGESKLPMTPPSLDKLYLIWETRPETGSRVLPSFLVLPDGKGRDFLAWSATFIGSVRPFTAFSRVLEWSLAKVIFDSFIPSETSSTPASFIGLVIGEALIRSNVVNPNNLTIVQCKSTASYAMAKIFSLGLFPLGLDTVMSKYHRLSKHNAVEAPRINIEDIYFIWVLAKRLLYPEENRGSKTWSHLIQDEMLGVKQSVFDYYLDYILSACHEIKTSGDISETTWNRVSNNSYEYAEMKLEMESTMERRVVFFEKVISNSAIRTIEVPLARNFITAYLAFKFNPGTLSHCALLGSLCKELPVAMIWYGFISGIYSKSDLLESFDCLGRRIARDISRRVDLFDHPTCDISIEEMDILSSGENQITHYKKFAEPAIKIELFPHINVYQAVSAANRDNSGSAKANASNYDQKLLVELGESLRRTNDIFSKIKSNVNTSSIPIKREPVGYSKNREQAGYYRSKPEYYPVNEARTIVPEMAKASKNSNYTKKKRDETESTLFSLKKDDDKKK